MIFDKVTYFETHRLSKKKTKKGKEKQKTKKGKENKNANKTNKKRIQRYLK